MNRHIIFLIISIGCAIIIRVFALPQLDKIRILYNIFNWIFQKIWVYWHLSTETFFTLISIVFAIIIYIFLEILWHCIDENPKITKDSARWATEKDIKNLMEKKGVPIGRFNGNILYYDEKPLVTCAGTRSGKGVGAIIPTLLEYPYSVFCLDIKGENYAITAKRRSQFSKVFAINPFGVLNIPTASYNWLNSIDIKNSDCITKANKMASMIVGRSEANSPDSHFDDQAIRLLQGVILYVCAVAADTSERNICTVKKLIHTMPIDDLCQEMAKYDDVANGEISSIGLQFLNNANEKEKGSIVSTAQRATNFLGNPDIQKTLEKSDFDISDLPSKLMSIYLIMKQDQIDDFKAYIRVFFDLALSSVISQDIDSRHKNHEVLFLLDEVAQLGYMKSLANAVSIIRGMGGQLWFFFQSYAQLKSVYGNDAQNILSNSAQIFYGCNDIETAELISKNLGEQKIVEYDIASKKDVTVKKRLLEPYQIRKLKADNPIIIISGINPIKVKKLCYFKDKEYKGIFDKNPYIK